MLEYEKKKGMIPLSEYTTTMKKNIQRAMKVGRVEVVRVTKVDTNKGKRHYKIRIYRFIKK